MGLHDFDMCLQIALSGICISSMLYKRNFTNKESGLARMVNKNKVNLWLFRVPINSLKEHFVLIP